MATKATRDKPWTQAEIDFINANPNMSYAGWAVALGRSRKGVIAKVQRLRRPRPPSARRAGAPPGEAHHKSVLTETQVREIRAKYALGGRSHFEIWQDYIDQVSALSTISAIITRKTWKHI